MGSRRFRETGRFVRRDAPPETLRPEDLRDLVRCLATASNAPLPIRIRGAGTAATDCNTSRLGTLIDMTGLDGIIDIDTGSRTVKVEAGVRLGELTRALASHGLELIGHHEQTERTVGGAIASPCVGAGIGEQAAYFSTQVIDLKLVTATGRVMKVAAQQKHLLNAVRLSYGALGAIFEATLRVRPVTTFSATHRELSIDTFADVSNRLAARDVGFKFHVLPHVDRVFLDLRRYERSPGKSYRVPWTIKDWGEGTALPYTLRFLRRVLPLPSVGHRLADELSATTHRCVNTRFVRNGNNVTATGIRRRRSPRGLLRSTWCFPASDFSVVIKAYREFCRETLAESGYRVDLPALGYRVARDESAVLSPSFDEPLIALQTLSTRAKGWEDFVIDLAQFAETWGGIPLFSDSNGLRAAYGKQAYAQRLEFFCRIRRQLDADGRLLNPFMAQYFE